MEEGAQGQCGGVFSGDKRLLTDESLEVEKKPLFEQIRRLQVEVDFPREKLGPFL